MRGFPPDPVTNGNPKTSAKVGDGASEPSGSLEGDPAATLGLQNIPQRSRASLRINGLIECPICRGFCHNKELHRQHVKALHEPLEVTHNNQAERKIKALGDEVLEALARLEQMDIEG